MSNLNVAESVCRDGSGNSSFFAARLKVPPGDGGGDVKFSQGSDFSAFSIRHWETVSPLCFSLSRSHTTHLLARSLARFFATHWPREMK